MIAVNTVITNIELKFLVGLYESYLDRRFFQSRRNKTQYSRNVMLLLSGTIPTVFVTEIRILLGSLQYMNPFCFFELKFWTSCQAE